MAEALAFVEATMLLRPLVDVTVTAAAEEEMSDLEFALNKTKCQLACAMKWRTKWILWMNEIHLMQR